MAYIQPNSTIEFFGDLNLSDNYDDTLYFPTVADKDAYFTALPKLATAPTCSYTRENRGFVRVEIPMSTLIGANYMRFKNTSFENKWWYAFVTKVDYVNNMTTEVQFEIDTIMSWMGVFTLNECYIERQHTLRDGIGNNICEEGLPVGEYVIQRHEVATLDGPIRPVLVYQPSDSDTIDGRYIGNIYHGFRVEMFDSLETLNSALTDLLKEYKLENVVGIYMAYKQMGDHPFDSIEKTISKPYDSLNGYVPRNKKLFCYPYNYLLVDNSQGNSHEYMYEYFNTLPDETSTGDCKFELTWLLGGNAEMRLCPEDYKGSSGRLLTERLGIEHFPQGSWSCNTYEAYLAQKNAYQDKDVSSAALNGLIQMGVSTAAGALTGSAFAGVGALPGAIIGGTVAGVKGIGDVAGIVLQNMNSARNKPTDAPMEMKGATTVNTVFADFAMFFHFYKMCISKNYAMMLDDYFDMFGYAVKQHGIPNMNARPNWTFVKTIGCSVGGNIPADDASAIEEIFNRGVRFWKNHNNIGNYSLNNAPA